MRKLFIIPIILLFILSTLGSAVALSYDKNEYSHIIVTYRGPITYYHANSVQMGQMGYLYVWDTYRYREKGYIIGHYSNGDEYRTPYDTYMYIDNVNEHVVPIHYTRDDARNKYNNNLNTWIFRHKNDKFKGDLPVSGGVRG